MSLAALLRWDVTLQARHHIFTANLVSTLAFCGFVALVPMPSLSPALASFFIFADPALIGLSFIGAVVLMERGARVNLALGVTPLPPARYVLSKAIVLSLSGTVSGLAVAASLAVRGMLVHWGLLVTALVASNLFAVLLGFLVVSTVRSMNQLMMRLLVVTMVLFMPLLSHFGATPWWLFAFIPSAPLLWWLEAGLHPTPDLARVALAAALLAAACVVAYRRAIGPAATAVFAATP
jgi:hypothetical protein